MHFTVARDGYEDCAVHVDAGATMAEITAHTEALLGLDGGEAWFVAGEVVAAAGGGVGALEGQRVVLRSIDGVDSRGPRAHEAQLGTKDASEPKRCEAALRREGDAGRWGGGDAHPRGAPEGTAEGSTNAAFDATLGRGAPFTAEEARSPDNGYGRPECPRPLPFPEGGSGARSRRHVVICSAMLGLEAPPDPPVLTTNGFATPSPPRELFMSDVVDAALSLPRSARTYTTAASTPPPSQLQGSARGSGSSSRMRSREPRASALRGSPARAPPLSPPPPRRSVSFYDALDITSPDLLSCSDFGDGSATHPAASRAFELGWRALAAGLAWALVRDSPPAVRRLVEVVACAAVAEAAVSACMTLPHDACSDGRESDVSAGRMSYSLMSTAVDFNEAG